MAIAFRSAAGDDFTGIRSPVVTKPTGATDDDILVTIMATDADENASGAPPAGWTKKDEGTAAGYTTVIYWRRVVAGDPASWTFTNVFATVASGRTITLCYSGCVTTGDPFDANRGSEISTASAAKDIGPITPATADCMALAILAGDPGTNTNSLFTWDGGITERIDGDTTPDGHTNATGQVAVAEQQLSGTPSTSMGGDYTSPAAGLDNDEWLYFLKPASSAQSVSITNAAETDTAQPLRRPKLTPATETAAAQALSVTKTIFKTLTAAAETDVAQILTFSQGGPIEVTLVAATETNAAQALNLDKLVALTAAAETNGAQAFNIDKLVTLTPGAETDLAVALNVEGVAATPQRTLMGVGT